MLAIANTGKTGRGFANSAGEGTGSVEISKEEIPGSKRSMYGLYTDPLQAKRENVKALCSHQMGL